MYTQTHGPSPGSGPGPIARHFLQQINLDNGRSGERPRMISATLGRDANIVKYMNDNHRKRAESIEVRMHAYMPAQ